MNKLSIKKFHVHLVSDATGDTVMHLTRACLSQFEHIDIKEHLWVLSRTEKNIIEILQNVKENGGVVVFTLVNLELKKILTEGCRELNIPCYDGLSQLIDIFEKSFNITSLNKPGSQYIVNDDYFYKVNAIDYTLQHDDGQNLDSLDEADIVLVGVSRTSKTPTTLYLAQHSIKAANVPLVSIIDVPFQLLNLKNAIVIGLTISPDRLVEIRKNRMAIGGWHGQTDYTSPESIIEEVLWARRLFAKCNWPVIDVTNRSIEEVAAAAIKIFSKQSGFHRPKLN